MVWRKAYFDNLNPLGVTDECDRRTDRHSRSKCRASLRCAAKNERITTKDRHCELINNIVSVMRYDIAS